MPHPRNISFVSFLLDGRLLADEQLWVENSFYIVGNFRSSESESKMKEGRRGENKRKKERSRREREVRGKVERKKEDSRSNSGVLEIGIKGYRVQIDGAGDRKFNHAVAKRF